MAAPCSWRIPGFVLCLLAACAVPACEFSDTDIEETPLERVLIRDADGRLWDVTQAVARFGFDPGGFLYGLGAFAVTPIIAPATAAPGDSGYPAGTEDFGVIGVAAGGASRAYRLDDLLDVEVVDDTLGAMPVVIVHRPLIGAPSAHGRTLDGAVLTLSASGWVYDGQSVLFDYETESLWYRLGGEAHLTCIAGPRFEATLPAVSFETRAWSAWRANRPATSFMLRR